MSKRRGGNSEVLGSFENTFDGCKERFYVMELMAKQLMHFHRTRGSTSQVPGYLLGCRSFDEARYHDQEAMRSYAGKNRTVKFRAVRRKIEIGVDGSRDEV